MSGLRFRMIFALIFFICLLFNWLLLNFLLVKVIDTPCHRSAHQKKVLRGGGIGFVSVFASYVILTSFLENISFILAILALSVLSFIDDCRGLSAKLRLGIQFIVCGIVAYSIEPTQLLVLLDKFELGLLAPILFAFYLVLAGNVYNFMDGLNGLAITQALFVIGGGLVLEYTVTTTWSEPLLVLFVCCLAFLPYNFPKAKLFMGDIGSVLLGVIFAFYSVTMNVSLGAWLILLGFFVVDSISCIVMRIIQKQNIFKAHNLHCYQKAARKYNSHSLITTGVIILNIFWLFPMSILYVYYSEYQSIIFAISYIPLLYIINVKFKSGALEN